MREKIEFTRTSIVSGKTLTRTLEVDYSDYEDWKAGKLIQDAMPYLNADDREWLLSGITAEEWNETFGDEE